MAGFKYGIDFGTCNIKIYKNGQGMALMEKNRIAVKNKKENIAYGNEAYAMYEKTPPSIVIKYPVVRGVIASTTDMAKVMDVMLKKIKCTNGFSGGNDFYFSVPSDLTEVEKRAFFDVLGDSEFKSKSVFIVEKPLAAALGMGINVYRTIGSMIIDIGSDTTEISVISTGGILFSRLLKMGSNDINEVLCEKVREKHQVLIGNKTAERLKTTLESTIKEGPAHKKVIGRHLASGLPCTVNIESGLVYEAAGPLFKEIVKASKAMIIKTPPEIIAEILNDGIYLTGGGSMMYQLSRLYSDEIGMKVNLSQKAGESVCYGLEKIMNKKELGKLAYSVRDLAFE